MNYAGYKWYIAGTEKIKNGIASNDADAINTLVLMLSDNPINSLKFDETNLNYNGCELRKNLNSIDSSAHILVIEGITLNSKQLGYIEPITVNYYKSSSDEIVLPSTVDKKGDAGSPINTWSEKGDYLYIPDVAVSDIQSFRKDGTETDTRKNANLKVGASGIEISNANWKEEKIFGNNAFWLRSDYDGGKALVANLTDECIGQENKAQGDIYVIPTFNLNLSNFPFASTVKPCEATFDTDGILTFRVVGDGNRITSSVEKTADKLIVKAGDGAEGHFLMVQYKKDGEDKIYCKKVSELSSGEVLPEELGIDSFDGCKVWIERWDNTNSICYARMATEPEPEPEPEHSSTIETIIRILQMVIISLLFTLLLKKI